MYPYKAQAYNENLSPKVAQANGREWNTGLARVAAMIAAAGSNDGSPPAVDSSQLSIQLHLRPSGLQNRTGVPGSGPGGLDGGNL